MNQERLEGYELSAQQRNVWRQPDRGLLWNHCFVELNGELDRPRLFRALARLTRRFSILRTTFEALPGMSFPLQTVPETPLGFHELGEGWRRKKPSIVDLDPFAAYRSDRDSPLWIGLASLEPDRHLLRVGLHSLCGDARTLSLLLEDLGRLYGGRTEIEADEPLPYIQFAQWQKELREGTDVGDGEPLRQEIVPVPDYLTESQPPSLDGERLDHAILDCDSIPRSNVSEQLYLLGVWKCLVWRLTTRTRFATAVELPGRGHALLDAVRGPLAQCRPISARFTPDSRLSDVLGQLGQELEKAAENHHFFLPSTRAERQGSAFAFSYHEWPERLAFGDLQARVAAAYSRLRTSAIHFNAVRKGSQLSLRLIVDGKRTRSGVAERLGAWMNTLLTRLAETPDAPLVNLPLTDPEETRSILFDASSKPVDFPADRCIHELFKEQVRRTPDALAVVDERSRLTYTQLDERAERLAGELARRGVGPESTAGILLERSADQVTALLAILKAGGAILPLDPTFPPKRLEWMLREAKPSVILTSSSLKELIAGFEAFLMDADWAGGAETDPGAQVLAQPSPDNLCYVLYTSGSTGRPKGVMVQHRSVVNLLAVLDRAVYSGRASGLRVGMNAPLTFDASVKQWIQLLKGHTLYVLPEAVRYDSRLLSDFLARHRLDVLDCTPSQLRPLLEVEQRHRPELLLIGGEEIDAELWSKLRGSGRFEGGVNVYGPTECTVDSSMARLDAWEEPTLGRALPNTRIYILDGYLNPVPAGVPGEIHIGGPGVGRGYLGQPGKTAERFLPDPFCGQPGRRMYRSGDRACWGPKGEIIFLGRTDHQVKLRGFRIELGEIEAVLRAHPAVLDAAALVRGELPAEPSLAAFVAAGGRANDPSVLEDLRSWLRDRLPEYMVPARIALLENLPASTHGKVDRRALADYPLPDPVPVRFVPPDNDVERRIAAIWRRVLEKERIGVEDNFFDIGGHSLLMAQAYSQLQEAFDRELSMIDLFRHPTVRSLAQFLANDSQAQPSFEDVKLRAQRQRRAFGAKVRPPEGSSD